MKVLILGIDGYLGWSLAMYLAKRNYIVSGMDNFSRRANVYSVGSNSAIPILNLSERLSGFEILFGYLPHFEECTLLNYVTTKNLLKTIKPDVIVHFAEQPSAPFSMRSLKDCRDTIQNNLIGTMNLLHAMRDMCPEAHLIKLGTMGEYGTPDCHIPEGFIPEPCLLGSHFDDGRCCPMASLPFPTQPGSWYHATKVFDSINIRLACNIWGLRSTDIMQGVVYGTRFDEEISKTDSLLHLRTRFDYDAYFGTVINRFCAQAVIGYPLTVYGSGGQRRSFLPLPDSMECIELLISNPPKIGEYRVVNQFDGVFSISQLAKVVAFEGDKLGLNVRTQTVPNPRAEKEDHIYDVSNSTLRKLGYKSKYIMSQVIRSMIQDLMPFREHIKKNVIYPTTRWTQQGYNGENRNDI